MNIISRKTAKALGLTRYFSGNACPRGHLCERFVSDYGCLECKIQDHSQWAKDNKEHLNHYQYQRYHTRNKTALEARAIDRAACNSAKARGLTQYISIRPCKRGHIGARYLNGTCVACKKASEMARKQRDPDAFLAAARLASKKYVETHAEKERLRRRLASRKRYEKHRKEVLETNRQWRRRNPSKVLQRNQRRRARERGVVNTLTHGEWISLCKRSPRCHWCGRIFTKKRKRTHDHIVPIVKGGGNTLENSCCACLECNRRKKDMSLHPITGQGILL